MEKLTEKDIIVMIDMQNDFIHGPLGSPAARAIVPRVVEFLEGLPPEVPVFYTMDTHGNKYKKTLEGRLLPVPHCLEGTVGWSLDSDVADAMYANEERVVECLHKETFGSDLVVGEIWSYMRMHDIKDPDELVLHVFGLDSDICLVSNALILREGFRNTRIICHADMCAGTSEEAHKAALTVMKSCQIEIVGE